MKDSFLLAWRSLVRAHVLSLLLVACGAIHLLMPSLIRSDGTADGWREMFVRAVSGSVFTVVLVSLLVCACGLFAGERERNLLPLSVVRPVNAFCIACGRWAALVLVAAFTLAFSCVVLVIRLSDAPNCRRHFQPSLPSPVVCARAILDDYLRDPTTPEAVRKAPKNAVLALLAGKESDRYESIPPRGELSWPFEMPGFSDLPILKVRFSTDFEMRTPVNGEITFGAFSGVVSNNTLSVLEVPLSGVVPANACKAPLVFRNNGDSAVMLRPRKDIELLLPADSFAANAVRAHLHMLFLVSLAFAFGLFLSSALSRPVAVFTALVVVMVVLMAPSVVAQFPDELETSLVNRIGISVSRFVSSLTVSVAEASPVADLAVGKAVTACVLLRSLVVEFLAVPCALLSVAAFVIRRNALGGSR